MIGTLPPVWEELLDGVVASRLAPTARTITLLESQPSEATELRRRIWAAGGRARVVGITGPPGSGKSTLVGAITAELRGRGRRVAIVAVDPSSSISGGAILGDRVRMSAHGLDEGVYVRSMSSRGALGGVSRATIDAVAVLDAAGWDDIIVETVGVGQAEVDVVRIASTVVVVSVPGLGDSIQTIKAGLLEVADIHVVNKADRPDSAKTVEELTSMLTLGLLPGVGDWRVPVLATVALDGEGIGDLCDVLDAHAAWAATSGAGARRRRAASEARVRAIVQELAVAAVEDIGAGAALAAAVDGVVDRSIDAHTAAEGLVDDMNRSRSSEAG